MNRWIGLSGVSAPDVRRGTSVVLVGLTLSLAGCFQPQEPRVRRAQEQTAGGMSKEELRDRLEDFEEYYQSTIIQASGDLDASTPDGRYRKMTLLWRVRMLPACHNALKQEDPLRAFLDTWLLCVRMTLYLDKGEGKTLFGDHQQIAVNASRQVLADIEHIGTLFLSEKKLAETQKEMVSLAETNPMRGVFAGTLMRATAAKKGEPNPFESILTLPLVPFKAFGGIDRGAAAIVGLTTVADRFTDVVEDLPETTRWQMELLMIQAQENDVTRSLQQSMESISSSAVSLAATAEVFPEEMRRQTSLLIEQMDAQQTQMQTTLCEVQNAAVAVEEALEGVGAASQSVGQTAASVTSAGQAWNVTAKTIAQSVYDIANLREPSTSQPATRASESAAAKPAATTRPARPTTTAATTTDGSSGGFDINDYRMTADSLTDAAGELRLLAAQVQTLIDSKEVSKHLQDVDSRVNDTVGRTALQLRGLTDLIAWRIGELVVLTFVLLLGYRFASLRLSASSR
jgi:hypothetical protein